RRQRLDGRGDDQDQAEHAEKDRERREPAAAGVAAPQSASEIADRAGRTRKDREAPAHPAPSLDHATCSFVSLADAVARLLTTTDPATSASMPHRRNVE